MTLATVVGIGIAAVVIVGSIWCAIALGQAAGTDRYRPTPPDL